MHSTTNPTYTRPHRVLVVGISYAGLGAVLNLISLAAGNAHQASSVELPPIPQTKLRNGLEITIVDERDGFFHTIGAPLALSSASFAPKCWMQFSAIPALQHPSITFIQGSVTKIDNISKAATYTTSNGEKTEGSISYDYLVAASGLRRQWPVVPQSLDKESYMKEVTQHITEVSKATDGVAVIGGGAVGIEMAAELKLTFPAIKVTLIHSRGDLLSNEPLSEEFKVESLKLLREMEVEVILSSRVTAVNDNEDGSKTVELNGNTNLKAGKVIWALSNQIPSTTYLPAEALDTEGLVKIRSSLNLMPTIENADSHFAPGDIASWSGIKRCGAAIMMGHLAAINIHQLILRTPEEQDSSVSQLAATTPIQYAKFPEVPPMIAVAIGRKAATYSHEHGVNSSEKLMESFFGEDLGRTIIWNWLKLGAPIEGPADSLEENTNEKEAELVVKMEEIAV